MQGVVYSDADFVATITSCSITQNTASMDGGFAKTDKNASVILSNCLISQNLANMINGGLSPTR